MRSIINIPISTATGVNTRNGKCTESRKWAEKASISLKTSNGTCGYLSIKDDEWIIRSFYYFSFCFLFGGWFFIGTHTGPSLLFFCWFCHKINTHSARMTYTFRFVPLHSWSRFTASTFEQSIFHGRKAHTAHNEWTTSITRIVLAISIYMDDFALYGLCICFVRNRQIFGVYIDTVSVKHLQ